LFDQYNVVIFIFLATAFAQAIGGGMLSAGDMVRRQYLR
jgi:hypothetical protein